VEKAKKNNEIYKARMNEYMKTKEEPGSKVVPNDVVSDKGKGSAKKNSNNYLASSDEENNAKANGDKKKKRRMQSLSQKSLTMMRKILTLIMNLNQHQNIINRKNLNQRRRSLRKKRQNHKKS